MSKVLKSLKRLFNKKRRDMLEETLVSHMISEPVQPAYGDPRQQTGFLLNADRFGTDPQMYPQDSILPDTLLGDIYFQELKDAAEQVKQWENPNSIIPDGNRGSGRLKVYLTAVERFVNSTFPGLPTNSQPLTEEYLNDAMTLICSKVTGLIPVLEDSELVRYLLDSYNCRLFDMLHFLMDRSSSVNDCWFLLQWVNKKYFSQDHEGCLIAQNRVLSVSDPLLLAEWLVYSKEKLLTLLRNNISSTLHNILQYDQSNSVCNGSNEEAFIQVQLDVIQCLDAPIQPCRAVSHTLKNAVQRLCCDELHSFIQMYVNAQRADEANLLQLFRTIYTCRQLMFYALSIMDSNSDTDLSTLQMLENMETQSLSSTQQFFGNIAEDNLKKYFKTENGHLDDLMVVIRDMLATLPQMEQAEETKQLILKAAYHSVASTYLQCLMQEKYKKLENRWDNVEKRIMCDAELFHSNFEQQNGPEDEHKSFLLTVAEILQCRDVDSVKLLYSNLHMTFPNKSEEYIPALLHWRGEFSRRQIKKVIDVSREVEDQIRNEDDVRPHRWCCLSSV